MLKRFLSKVSWFFGQPRTFRIELFMCTEKKKKKKKETPGLLETIALRRQINLEGAAMGIAEYLSIYLEFPSTMFFSFNTQVWYLSK